MTAVVTMLPLGEPARFNPGQLEKLCEKLGDLRAETEVAHALDRLSVLLDDLARCRRSGDHADMGALLAALVHDAQLIGMATLARVGQDVHDCLHSGDPTALAATLARLLRVGDRSIHAIWDLEDVSG
ncbi:hypothetical protein MACH21_33810 [Roseicyclus marinus]|jgi:hypothetical protein|uniref:Hpt domain-containing protein n=2 Tax=Roseobacteraceae TaxID=2854170 RepID=A0AA48HKD7_9RHOB|nr:hypothetical protein MACH21_33810 [Roseicyclus marinus]